jgi:hypothetical protein
MISTIIWLELLGVELADPALFLVRQTRGHRTTRDEDDRQVTECQTAHEQARHDLVADAEQQRPVEHLVR